MRALAGSGRRSDALRAFQAHRSLLVDETGTEPSAVLVELDRLIARRVTTDDADLRAMFPPQRSTSSPRGISSSPALPVAFSSFVGRAEELRVLPALLREHRLVTLTGAGGCGKTRLALHLATTMISEHCGGTWWVELARVEAAAQVAERWPSPLGSSRPSTAAWRRRSLATSSVQVLCSW